MQFILKTVLKKFIKQELSSVGFDKGHLESAIRKHLFLSFKIFNLSNIQATILKQTALSKDCDCALSRGVLDNSVDFSDCILSGTVSQLFDVAKSLARQQFSMKNLALEIEKSLNLELTSFDNSFENKDFVTSDTKKTPKIMGILNITPDSFSDGGEFLEIEKAINHAIDMMEEGASIIDIGAQSTRPGAEYISPDLETEKITPIVAALKTAYPDLILSVDTFSEKTAKCALDLGCDIINDVSFLKNPQIASLVKEYGKKLVIMHTRGSSKTMDSMCQYDNITDEIYLDLRKKTSQVQELGLDAQNIIIDLGFGFAKDNSQNFKLLSRISEFRSLGFEVLAGVSRKRFLQSLINTKEPKDADFITAVTSFYLAGQGIDYIRVHNVKLTAEALKLHSALG